MYYKLAIERYPLQTYMSTLLFSPKQSMIRKLYAHEESKEITVLPPVAEQWNTCLQTLEGHSDGVRSVVFSHDSTRLASASDDSTIKIWDARNGDCLQTLEGHSSYVTSVVFSHDSTRLASASGDSTVKIWDARNGDCLHTLQDHRVDDLSAFFLQHPHGRGMPEDSEQPQRSLDRSIAISQDRSWVTRNSQKVLWLPSEYRPVSYSVSAETVGMGTGSGRVWICRFRDAD
jgi:WD40 repeat protein